MNDRIYVAALIAAAVRGSNRAQPDSGTLTAQALADADALIAAEAASRPPEPAPTPQS